MKGGSFRRPYSRRASICGWATMRGRCAAASCPTVSSTVEEKAEDVAFDRIDLRDGATLERDRPYLVPLVEELRLPQDDPRQGESRRARPGAWTSSRAYSPTATTASMRSRPDIRAGSTSRSFRRTFAIRVKTGLALNQVRLICSEAPPQRCGADGRPSGVAHCSTATRSRSAHPSCRSTRACF